MNERRFETFSASDLRRAEQVAILAARAVADSLQNNYGTTEFSEKSNELDWVTEHDVSAQQEIIEIIKDSQFSNSEIGILAEEEGVTTQQDTYWTIDPIDGTSAFVRGLPFCSTMIALVHKGTPVAGVINDFVNGDTYSASTGNGSWLNETERLRVSERPLEQSQYDVFVDITDPDNFAVVNELTERGAALVRSNTAGFGFISVARGATEAVACFNNHGGIKEWDMAPATLLIKEAGGLVFNVGEGTEDLHFTTKDSNFVAANPIVAASLKQILDTAISRHL